MSRTIIIALFCGCLANSQFWFESIATAQRTWIASDSDGVVFQEIYIARQISRGALKSVKLSNMQITLWFATKWKNDMHHYSGPALIHLKSLSKVEDDTGRSLSTDDRLRKIKCLQGEFRSPTKLSDGTGKRFGPEYTLVLDAPARRASKIKEIKGEAKVTMTKKIDLAFEGLGEINGTFLKHEKMKSLSDLKLKFSITSENGKIEAKIHAPFNYESPWNLGRLDNWWLMDGEDYIHLTGRGLTKEDGGYTVSKRYRPESFNKLSLHVVVLEPVESKTFNFSFKNVKLPD